jgi:hypothetical protein
MLRNRAELSIKQQVVDIALTLAELRADGKQATKLYDRLRSKRSKLIKVLKAEGKAAA